MDDYNGAEFNGPAPNVPLLRKAVEWAEAEHARPDGGAWLQSSWSFDVASYVESAADDEERAERLDILANSKISPTCGTAYCIAGYVAHVDGVMAKNDDVVTKEGEWISEYAERALGLTHSEANALFRGSNSIDDVREIAAAIADRAGETL